MIKNPQVLQKFNNAFYKNQGTSPFLNSLKIFTSMWNQGVAMGVLPPKDPMEGIETDIKIARVLNTCSKNSCQK
jgi:hypothetical protein